MQSRVQGDREAPRAHEQVGHGQVQQDVVERRPQLFVFDGDIEGEEVDGEGGADEEQHVRSQERVLPGLGQVVLRVLEGAADHPRLVRHGDVKVGSLCAIHGCSC